jgi:hypothetical protein
MRWYWETAWFGRDLETVQRDRELLAGTVLATRRTPYALR